MKILILEDEDGKFESIDSVVKSAEPDAEISRVTNWYDYAQRVASQDFDLILLDIIVPRSAKSPKAEDHCDELVETTRSLDESRCFKTPAIVLTQYLEQSEGFAKRLNAVDITVIHFDLESKIWREALTRKISAARPPISFDFLIVCALPKEALAFSQLGAEVQPAKTIEGLTCRQLRLEGLRGVIVTPPRMGLVSAAVITSFCIERLRPRLVCMSGICGGILGETKIYDTVVSDLCYQHDVGKWSRDGFKYEHYDAQISGSVRSKVEEMLDDPEFITRLRHGFALRQSEFPNGVEEFDFDVRIGTTSSGSAVIAQTEKVAEFSEGHRKLCAFEMEIYALYEACRLSGQDIPFFAVKSVVDDGGENKGDRFHRVGCLLSAKFLLQAIPRILQ